MDGVGSCFRGSKGDQGQNRIVMVRVKGGGDEGGSEYSVKWAYR